MTTYKNERNRKKLLAPIVALMLCAMAMIGLGYAALTSTAANTDNVVGAEGLVVKLVNEDGTPLGSSGFDEYGGVSTIKYSSEQEDVSIKYKIDTFEDLILGGAILNIHVGNEDTTKVKIYYELTWVDHVNTTYGITTSLLVGGTNVDEIADSTTAVDITLDAVAHTETGQNFNLVLNGDISEYEGLENKPPEQLKYTITIYVLLE